MGIQRETEERGGRGRMGWDGMGGCERLNFFLSMGMRGGEREGGNGGRGKRGRPGRN